MATAGCTARAFGCDAPRASSTRGAACGVEELSAGRTGKGDPEASPVVCGAVDANDLCSVHTGGHVGGPAGAHTGGSVDGPAALHDVLAWVRA
jgi:hypothetical protein